MNDFLQSLRNGQAEKPRTPKTRKNSENSYHYSSPNKFHSYGGYQNNRSQQMKRQPAQQQQVNQSPMGDTATTSMFSEAIENLSIHIETLANNQENLVNAQQRTADMIERQAIVLERILDHFDISRGKETAPEKKTAPKKVFKNHYVTSKKPTFRTPEPAETPIETPVEKIKVTKSSAETSMKSHAKAAIKSPVKSPVKSIVRKRKKIVEEKTGVTASTDSKLMSREAIMDIIETMRNEGATFGEVASRLVELGQPTFSGRGEWHAQTIHRLCSKK